MNRGESKNLPGYDIKYWATIKFSEEATKRLQLVVMFLSLFNGNAEKLIKSPWKHNGTRKEQSVTPSAALCTVDPRKLEMQNFHNNH